MASRSQSDMPEGPQKTGRHTWSRHVRRPDPHHSIRCCLKCGITKTTRKEIEDGRPVYWIEFHDQDGKRIRIEGDLTPACEPVEVEA